MISAELELNGRRLVVMEALSKNEAIHKKGQDDSDKKTKIDKRNLDFKKEGLLNFEDWVH